MKKKKPKKFLLYGKNSIKERMRVNPRSIRRIFLSDSFDDVRVLELIRNNKIPCQTKNKNEMIRTKRADRLQGIIAEVEPFLYTPLENILEESHKYSILILDGLNDPQNIGAVIRTAACFGGFALVIPKHRSCEINETVLHIASGGENFVPVSQVTNISGTIAELKKYGYWIAGSVVNSGENISDVSLPFPVCLILGSEGKGISPGLIKHIDLKLSIPMQGAPLSFNVAASSSIFCYEIFKQSRHPYPENSRKISG